MSYMIDNIVYKFYLYKRYVKDKEDIKPYTHTLKNPAKLKYDQDGNLIVLKYPSNYNYKFFYSHSFGMCAFISFFWGIQNYYLIRLFKKFKSYKFLYFSAFSLITATIEAKYVSTRTKDVKEVVLTKDNKLKIRTFHDTDPVFVMDIKDVYIITLDQFTVFFVKTGTLINFFVLEPEHGNLPNSYEIYDLVFKDKRYLKF